MSFDMVTWMLMDASIRASNHMRGVKLDGVTPGNHVYYELDSGHYYMIKGDSGYPWDINGFDATNVYLSTTENGAGRGGGYADPYQGKRFESLDPSIGYKGAPFALRTMNSGDFVVSPPASALDSGHSGRIVIYGGSPTSCAGTNTVTAIGHIRCELSGPFSVNYDTIAGHASGNLGNITVIILKYRWGGTDPSPVYGTQEEFHYGLSTTSGPWGGSGVQLGLVHWQTENWNSGTGSYDPPTDGTYNNQFTAGSTGLPSVDPCGFGIDFGGGGGGSATLRLTQSVREALITASPLARVTQSIRESLITGTPSDRVTQSIREALITGVPKSQVAQSVREAIITFSPNARIAQSFREAIIPVIITFRIAGSFREAIIPVRRFTRPKMFIT